MIRWFCMLHIFRYLEKKKKLEKKWWQIHFISRYLDTVNNLVVLLRHFQVMLYHLYLQANYSLCKHHYDHFYFYLCLFVYHLSVSFYYYYFFFRWNVNKHFPFNSLEIVKKTCISCLSNMYIDAIDFPYSDTLNIHSYDFMEMWW